MKGQKSRGNFTVRLTFLTLVYESGCSFGTNPGARPLHCIPITLIHCSSNESWKQAHFTSGVRNRAHPGPAANLSQDEDEQPLTPLGFVEQLIYKSLDCGRKLEYLE